MRLRLRKIKNQPIAKGTKYHDKYHEGSHWQHCGMTYEPLTLFDPPGTVIYLGNAVPFRAARVAARASRPSWIKNEY
jgi:hypothetical protein